MRETISVELGDRLFEIEDQSIKESKVWRPKFVECLQPLLDFLPGLPDVDITKPEELVKLFPILQKLLTDNVDDAIEMLLEFSEVLEKDRGWIEDNASAKQAIAALVGVLKMTNPFDVAGLQDVLTGPESKETSSKSPSRSGGSRRRSSKSASR